MAAGCPGSVFQLLASKERCSEALAHSIPAEWPKHLRTFLAHLEVSAPRLPKGAAFVVLVDVARTLHTLGGEGATDVGLRRFTDNVRLAESPHDVMRREFEEAVSEWFARLEPGCLVPATVARRIALYVDQHSSSAVTLQQLEEISGWDRRYLSRAFRLTMGKSIRDYLASVRVKDAASRLRAGDKVESVLAEVGWRGRKNFFRRFREQTGMTPAQYREQWRTATRSAGGHKRTSAP